MQSERNLTEIMPIKFASKHIENKILPNPIKWLLDKISVVSTPVPYFNLYHPIKLLHPY